MMALIVGLVVGYLLAIPPGPIGMAAARTGLRQGRNASRMLALGAGLFDMIYCLAAMSASVGVASLLHFDASQSLGAMLLAMIVAVAIAGVGVYQFRNPVELSLGEDDRQAHIKGTRPFMTGVAYALANLANPTFIPSLLVMTAYILGMGLVGPSLLDRLLFSLGFGVGNVLWLVTLVSIVLRYRSRLPQSTFTLVQRLMAATVVGFGVVSMIRLVAL